MGTKIPRLLQKALSSFPWLRRNSGEHGESRRLLPKGASKRNTKNAQESDDFPYYTHSIGAEADHSPAIAVPIKDWPPPQGYHPDPLVPFIKYLMFFFNFIFFTLGFGLLCFGFWGLADKQSLMVEKIGNLGTDPMLIFVLVGLVVCVLSFSGCVGFIRENLCLLKFFFAAMVTLLVAQSVVALVVLCFHEQIQDSVKMTMMLAISRYQDDSDLQFLLDEIQLGMECCGVQSYEDWSVNLYFNCSSPGVNSCGVPYSCCIDPLQNGTVPNSQCGFGALSMSEAMASSLIYLGGCVPQLVLWINRRSWDIAALYLSLPATQLFPTADRGAEWFLLQQSASQPEKDLRSLRWRKEKNGHFVVVFKSTLSGATMDPEEGAIQNTKLKCIYFFTQTVLGPPERGRMACWHPLAHNAK